MSGGGWSKKWTVNQKSWVDGAWLGENEFLMEFDKRWAVAKNQRWKKREGGKGKRREGSILRPPDQRSKAPVHEWFMRGSRVLHEWSHRTLNGSAKAFNGFCLRCALRSPEESTGIFMNPKNPTRSWVVCEWGMSFSWVGAAESLTTDGHP